MDKALTVYFDGSCPLCRREIAWYRGRRGAQALAWVDVSRALGADAAPDLPKDVALSRFHVRLPDGRLVSGGRAFAELWSHLPGLRVVGRAFRYRPLAWVLELAYVAFLPLRPHLQRAARGGSCRDSGYPPRLERELRSDHAGETGAVAIYRGILAVSRDAGVRAFAARHLQTESRHLSLMEGLLPRRRSRLLPLWRLAGFLTGALPALVGPRAVYATVDAVESFVDRHYAEQIAALTESGERPALRAILEQCRHDELEHRDEARALLGDAGGPGTRLWQRIVRLGSAGGVAVARRF